MKISFQNATINSGISYPGKSWGVSWIDFNKDSLLDLWVNNHQDTGIFYLNQGNGNFLDITNTLFPTLSSGNESQIESDLIVIEIDAINFGGGLTPGILDRDLLILGNVARDSDDRFIYDRSTGQLQFDVDGTGNSNPIVLATLSNLPQLSADNIAII